MLGERRVDLPSYYLLRPDPNADSIPMFCVFYSGFLLLFSEEVQLTWELVHLPCQPFFGTRAYPHNRLTISE